MRALIVLFVLFAGCVDTIDHRPDAHVDADVDATGSGGGMAVTPSPRDSNLELVVLAASLVVMLGPVTARRRRRKEMTDSLPFS